MSFSMSTSRGRSLPRPSGPQPVRLFGYDSDGGSDGLPVVLGRGKVDMNADGPDHCVVYDSNGHAYEPAQTLWDPTAHEWICEARRVERPRQASKEQA